ncbi:MAG: hypothetical protein AAF740_07845, partial [Bacteroidota bacterium]
MNKLIYSALALLLTFSVHGQACTDVCPSCPASGSVEADQNDDLSSINLNDDEEIVEFSGNYNSGDIEINNNSTNNGETTYICIEAGVTVDVGSMVIKSDGDGDVVVINRGEIILDNQIQLFEDVSFYNCGTIDINGGNGMQLEEGSAFFNTGTVDMEGVLQIKENSFMCNASVIDIGGNIQNEGETVSPNGGCGQFNVTGSSTSQNTSTGDLGISGGALAINVCIAFDDQGDTGADVDISCGAMCVFAPLPVELLFFTAEAQQETTLLEWATTNETNNAYFGVERSTDGKYFKEVGYVEGHGTSRETQTYCWEDTQPVHGDAYYRLRQVDFDGTENFSKVRHAYWTSADFMLELYP